MRVLKEADSRTHLLKGKFEELKVQLALGKAESRDAFTEQRKQIEKIMREIEGLLDSHGLSLELHLKWRGEMERFKILLEIIGLQYALDKMELKERLEKNKTDFKEKVEKLKTKFSEKQHSVEGAFEDFWNEAKDAYHELKMAFTK